MYNAGHACCIDMLMKCVCTVAAATTGWGMPPSTQGQPLMWQASNQALPGEVVAAGDPATHQQALEILQAACG